MEEGKVFKDLKVADFCWAIVGPITTKYLADFGATVVRVESRKRVDPMRTTGPFKHGKTDPDESGYQAAYNTNKYSISLDMENPKGIELAREIILWADVVAESFRPGVMEKWGLGYEQMKKIKPDIIHISSSTLGYDGPQRSYGGAGFLLVALGGFSSFIGYPGSEPMRLPHAYTDFVSPRFCASALVAALLHRKRTGEGAFIDVSQLESSVMFLLPGMLDYTVNKREPTRTGNASSWAAPHGVYRCQGTDRWIAIAVSSDEEWTALCNTMGKPHLVEDSRFATFRQRKKHEAELDGEIEAWTSNMTAEEIVGRLQSVDVAAGVVQNSQDIMENPQLRSRGIFWNLEHPRMGPFNFLGQPFTLSKTPPKGVMPSPCLGEHTEYVCTQLLGMKDEDFLAYMNEGIFE
ncbi:CaiB/BaiF CoA transferase family protein [Chloroflexota bacterium]